MRLLTKSHDSGPRRPISPRAGCIGVGGVHHRSGSSLRRADRTHRARAGTLASRAHSRALAPRALLVLLEQGNHIARRQVTRLKEERLVARILGEAFAD